MLILKPVLSNDFLLCTNPKICQFKLYWPAQLRYSSGVHRQLQEKHEMSEQKKQINLWPTALIFTIILTVMVSCGSKPSAEDSNKPEDKPAQSAAHPNEPAEKDIKPTVTPNEAKKDDTVVSTGPKVTLNDIVKAATTWGPAYQSWHGQTAPDFTLADINGKQHKLSDYRGKNVMLVFWATWCPPCRIEIPHLIELRKSVGTDKLAILAISDENTRLVKTFAADRKLNYTVLLNQGKMASPYNMVRSIPSSFFIKPNGKIKLATVGLLSSGEVKAILKAE